MSATAHAQLDDHEHDDHGHHHKETFVTKYIFSQDHKMKTIPNYGCFGNGLYRNRNVLIVQNAIGLAWRIIFTF